MMLLNKLEKNGIIDALSEIGFSAEKMFSDLDETSDTLYSKYEWVISECHVDGVDKQYVINAIPNDFSKLAWEEWYSSGGKPIHHILCADKWAECLAAERDNPLGCRKMSVQRFFMQNRRMK